MTKNFPNSPNINDTFTSNGVTFKWDGTAWKQPSSNDTINGVKDQRVIKERKGLKRTKRGIKERKDRREK